MFESESDQEVFKWYNGKRDEGDGKWDDSPEGLFCVSWVDKIPTDDVETTDDDSEDDEDNHAKPAIAPRGGSIEERDMRSIRMDGPRCEDAECGVEYKGGKV